MARLPLIALVSGTVLAASACSAQSIRTQEDYNRSTYDYSNFSIYHAGRDTRVVIHGNPFSMDRQAFERTVTDQMEKAHGGQATDFTTTPDETAAPDLRVVLAFNPVETVPRLCRDMEIPTRDDTAAFRLTAAWCWGDRRDSYVDASAGAISGPNDPQFRKLVAQVMAGLFPKHMEREFRGNDDDNETFP